MCGSVVDQERNVTMIFQACPDATWIEMLWGNKKFMLEYTEKHEPCKGEPILGIAKNGSVICSAFDVYVDILWIESHKISSEEKQELMQLIDEGIKATRPNIPGKSYKSISARFRDTQWKLAPEKSQIFNGWETKESYAIAREERERNKIKKNEEGKLLNERRWENRAREVMEEREGDRKEFLQRRKSRLVRAFSAPLAILLVIIIEKFLTKFFGH
jgi:hypothetical protein